MANLAPASSVSRNPTSLRCSLPTTSTLFRVSPKILRLECQLEEIDRTQLNLSDSSSRKSQDLKMKAAQEPPAVATKKIRREKFKTAAEKQDENELFDELKDRFLSFKRNKYLGDLEKYGNLAKGQAPKFMVVACGDSRVCPSVILGFEPGEAFIIRNIANLVPPFESGPTETNAALEFAVNALQVENILIIGHSCCGGIRALMSLQEEKEADDSSRSFIKSWVSVGKNARANTKAAASDLSFDQQCRHCEKESVNRSLSHLLTYPWIEEKVMSGTLSLHGGYYGFIDCTFEKWTLHYIGTAGHAVKNRSFWR